MATGTSETALVPIAFPLPGVLMPVLVLRIHLFDSARSPSSGNHDGLGPCDPAGCIREASGVRRGPVVVTMMSILLIAAYPIPVEAPSWAVGIELLGGPLGGVVGAAIGIVTIGGIAPSFDSRAARIAKVISGVTLGGGLGATAGVLAAGKLLDIEGSAPGCLLGAPLGGLASTFAEPLLYLLGIPEETTELLGFLFLPIGPAVGATIGFNWSVEDPG